MKRFIFTLVMLFCFLLNSIAQPPHHHHEVYHPRPYGYYPVHYRSYPVYYTTHWVTYSPRDYIKDPHIAQLTQYVISGDVTPEDYQNRIRTARGYLHTESVIGWSCFTASILSLAFSPLPLALCEDRRVGYNTCLGMAVGGGVVSILSLIPIYDAESKKYDIMLSIKATGITLTF